MSGSDDLERVTRRAYVAARWMMYLACASFVFTSFTCHDSRRGQNPYYLTGEILLESAPGPQKQRLLVPYLSLAIATPVEDLILDSMGDEQVQTWAEYLGSTRNFLIPTMVSVAIGFLCFLGLLLAARRLSMDLFDGPAWVVDAAPVFFLLTIPLMSHPKISGYVYDFPAAFSFTLLLALAYRSAFKPYFVVYFVAMLNKETMILATVAFVAFQWTRLERKTLFKLIGLHAGLFVLAKAIAILIAGTAPSAPLTILQNLESIAYDKNLYSFSEVGGVLVFGLLVFARFSDKPAFLRRALWVWPAFFAAYIAGGFWGETRVFYEVWVIAAFMAFQTIVEVIGAPITARSEPRPMLDRIPIDGTPAKTLARAAITAGIAALLLASAGYRATVWAPPAAGEEAHESAENAAPPTSVNLEDVQTIAKAGTPWDAKGNTAFTREIFIKFDQTHHPQGVELTLSKDDTYRVTYTLGGNPHASEELNSDEGSGELGVFVLRLDEKTHKEGIDMIHIAGMEAGKRRRSLGHLKLLETVPDEEN